LNNNTIAKLAVFKLIEKPMNKRKDNNHKRKKYRWAVDLFFLGLIEKKINEKEN
jgi:hypothetical protein